MNHVSKNITFDSDGVYRWAYELNLYKNPTILFLIWKIFGGILLALWLFMVVLEVIDDNLSLDNLPRQVQECNSMSRQEYHTKPNLGLF